MGTTHDAKLRFQQLQAQADALRRERADAIAHADELFGKACRGAADRRNKAYRQVKEEYEPKIRELEKRQSKERAHFGG